ncbi:phosphoribosylanthranilate isomerase [Natronorubrum aibiense]|uniref:N-(5'-phosphoribosyl)anthranilate isomerase n=1 Tax=Natronorubrum aibiense TaxID=348826 RepID=A0A5P9P7X4_9EURY|nr:phosphoribosylanthranilate isomerase [Natronorubrum aibiense]QFU83900.1 phosphoribosylanthranilate isomerase [Natronorubrum aibiense]
MTRVKVCGLTTEDDLETAVDAGVDAVGFICDVTVDTPREVSVDRARELVAAVPPFVTAVLVTMPSSPERTLELADAVGPDALQIHSTLGPADLAAVRSELDTQLLYAIDADDATDAAAYDDTADALLVDTPAEDGGGGTGETHDWDRTRRAARDLESPLILAGGLTPDNVVDAIRTVEPFAVDVASGVEAADGSKDPAAVHSFVDRAMTAHRAVEPDSSQLP